MFVFCQNIRLKSFAMNHGLQLSHANYDTHTYTRLMALFWDYPGEPVPVREINLDFTEARDSE